MTIICVTFSILGLEKYISIIGSFGPAIILVVLGTGIISLFRLSHQIPGNLELLRSGAIDTLTIGTNPWMSGALLGGFTLLLGVAFMSSLGSNYRQYRYSSLLLVNVIGLGLVYVGCAIMGLTHLANLTESLKYPIPNVSLMQQLGLGSLAIVLSLFIYLAVISSAIPSIWSVARTFFFEKTRNFNILIIVLAAISYVIVCFVPYTRLMNFTFTYAGYAGLVVGVVILYYYIRYIIKNKKIVATGKMVLEERPADFEK